MSQFIPQQNNYVFNFLSKVVEEAVEEVGRRTVEAAVAPEAGPVEEEAVEAAGAAAGPAEAAEAAAAAEVAVGRGAAEAAAVAGGGTMTPAGSLTEHKL